MHVHLHLEYNLGPLFRFADIRLELVHLQSTSRD